MPRSLQEILDHADDLATRFEDYEPDPDDERDPEPHRALVAAVAARSRVEQEIAEAVQRARAAGYTWADIGALLGTTGQAASQRYGRRVKAQLAVLGGDKGAIEDAALAARKLQVEHDC